MNIEVLFKNQYGKWSFYPISQDADTFCKLMQTSTLTGEQLITCHERGWKVDIHTQKLTIDDVKDYIKDKKERKSNKNMA